jgi:hypothetical protein
VVPDGVSTIHVVATGAPGAVGGLTAGNGDPAGSGAQVSGDLAVTLGQKLFVNVGGAPTSGSCGFGVACNGGFNGGGTSMFGGGGGASDVRTVSRDQPNSLESRLIVAGGGGGSGANQSCPGGAGGDAGSAGGDGASSCSNTAGGTGGGAVGQNAGGAGGIPLGGNGSLGQGGNGGGLYGLTGGGGGYYGGGDVGRGLRYNSGAGVEAAVPTWCHKAATPPSPPAARRR